MRVVVLRYSISSVVGAWKLALLERPDMIDRGRKRVRTMKERLQVWIASVDSHKNTNEGYN